MKSLASILAAVLVCNVSLAQVATAVKEGAKATGEKAAQYGDQAKAAVSSQPNKAAAKTKAQVHKANTHAHATGRARSAAPTCVPSLDLSIATESAGLFASRYIQ